MVCLSVAKSRLVIVLATRGFAVCTVKRRGKSGTSSFNTISTTSSGINATNSSFIGATKCFWASYRKAICGVTALNPSGLGIFSGTPPTEMSVDQLSEDERRRNVRMINLIDLSVMLEMGGERFGRLWAVRSMGMAESRSPDYKSFDKRSLRRVFT